MEAQGPDIAAISGSLKIAHELVSADEPKRAEIIHALRQNGKLSSTVRAFNQLLTDPERKGIAVSALKAIGLDQPG